MPDLSGRKAKCGPECAVVESNENLAFFRFRGAGSQDAITICKHCHMHRMAHQHDNGRCVPTSVVERGECLGFEAQGAQEFDHYYCGHSGWD